MGFDAYVAIIGAGPLGIELAAALKLAGISYLLFDKGQVGQMIYNFPPQTHFFSSNERISIAGISIQTIDQLKCSREEYLAHLRTVVEHYQLQINSFEEVTEVVKRDGYEIVTPKRAYNVQFLVVATGSTSTPRMLGIPGENLPHVSTKMIDPHLYFQQKVAIIGGKNSAAETALRLFQAGAFPHLIMREPLTQQSVKYWLLPELEGRIAKSEILLSIDYEAVEIKPGSLKIKNRSNGKTETIAADFVIKAIGFEADMSLLEKLGVELITSVRRPVFNAATMETNVADLYVLGTVVGGTQRGYKIFIENSHVHVRKIMVDIASKLGCTLPEIDWIQKNDAIESNLEQ